MRLTITVHGQPAPQGSKKAFALRGKDGIPTGRVAVVEQLHDRVAAASRSSSSSTTASNPGGKPSSKPPAKP